MLLAALKKRRLVPESFKPVHLLAVGVAVVTSIGLLATLALVSTSSDIRQQAASSTYVIAGTSCSKAGEYACGPKPQLQRFVCDGAQWRATGQKCSTKADVNVKTNSTNAKKDDNTNNKQGDNVEGGNANPEPTAGDRLSSVPSDGTYSLICPANADGCTCVDVTYNNSGGLNVGLTEHPIEPTLACSSNQRIFRISYDLETDDSIINGELAYAQNMTILLSAHCPDEASTCTCVNVTNYRDQVDVVSGQNCPTNSAMLRVNFTDGGAAVHQELAVDIRDRQANTCFGNQWYGEDGLPTGWPCVFGGGGQNCSICPTGSPPGPCAEGTVPVELAHGSCTRNYLCDNGYLIPDDRVACSN
jgi:hypothetical protein